MQAERKSSTSTHIPDLDNANVGTFEGIQLSGNQSVISERKPGAYREIYIITDEYWER